MKEMGGDGSGAVGWGRHRASWERNLGMSWRLSRSQFFLGLGAWPG